MDCPICGLINPDTAQRFDCGYDFDSRRVERSYLDDRPLDRRSSGQDDAQLFRLAASISGLCTGAGVWLLSFLSTVSCRPSPVNDKTFR